MIFGLLKLIACNGDLGGAGGVDQGPAGLQGRLHPPDADGDGVGARREIRTCGVDGKAAGVKAELGIPEGDLGPQIRLGLLHLAGDGLEVGVVHLRQDLHLVEAQGAQLGDAHLAGTIRQGEGRRRHQIAELGGQGGGRRGQHLRIGLGAIALQGGSQGQGFGQLEQGGLASGSRQASRSGGGSLGGSGHRNGKAGRHRQGGDQGREAPQDGSGKVWGA